MFATIALVGLCVSAKVQQGKEVTVVLTISEMSSLQPAHTLQTVYLDEDNNSSTHLT
jgi:hypothetical protein